MDGLHLRANAKINLSLDILGRRPDGYHEMDMVMQTITLCDEITLCRTPSGISLTGTTRPCPATSETSLTGPPAPCLSGPDGRAAAPSTSKSGSLPRRGWGAAAATARRCCGG